MLPLTDPASRSKACASSSSRRAMASDPGHQIVAKFASLTGYARHSMHRMRPVKCIFESRDRRIQFCRISRSTLFNTSQRSRLCQHRTELLKFVSRNPPPQLDPSSRAAQHPPDAAKPGVRVRCFRKDTQTRALSDTGDQSGTSAMTKLRCGI